MMTALEGDVMTPVVTVRDGGPQTSLTVDGQTLHVTSTSMDRDHRLALIAVLLGGGCEVVWDIAAEAGFEDAATMRYGVGTT